MSWKIPEWHIDEIIAASKEEVWRPFPGITVVAWQLPNGYTISAQSGVVDPAEDVPELGLKYAREHLKSKVWELEGYVRKNQWAEAQE